MSALIFLPDTSTTLYIVATLLLRCLAFSGSLLGTSSPAVMTSALRACLWVLGISALLGNIAVIVLRTILEKERRGTTQGRERRGARPGQERRVQPFLLINLAVSDFLMGTDLPSDHRHKRRAVAGRVFQTWLRLEGRFRVPTGRRAVHVIQWSFSCDADPHHFRQTCLCRFSVQQCAADLEKSLRLVCCHFWIFGIVISCLPVVGMEYFSSEKNEAGFFGRSSVCLPLQLSEDKPGGWEYSVGFFIALNLFAFIFILLAYIAKLWNLWNIHRSAISAKQVWIDRSEFDIASLTDDSL